ncbi:MAG: ATP-binding protein [Desulfobacteraceae bacterium]|nr:ATP-binding protein [Desulfobacteraceae bacterium]
MKEVHLPPKAAALSESMRDLGYSLETAIADIIDNSISAGASNINILFDIHGANKKLGIIDDGNGMTDAELIESMRCGAKGPNSERGVYDLGRFGLGLKTASFSQCTKLTVISKKNGLISGAVWDLVLISLRDEWIIGSLDKDEIQSTPYIEFLGEKGTLVLWENLDRLSESETDFINESLFYSKINLVEKHLALVFHRFLSGEAYKQKKISISINNHPISSFDPFCSSNDALQILQKEIIRINGEKIIIQPYILPHHSKLSNQERDYYNNRSNFLNNQGVYVYRNYRLMAWGDWFRLIAKGEPTKLARVRIDFPTALDEYWTIDIKKSRAHPPFPVREQLKKIIGKITDQSIKVHTGRGKRLYQRMPKPVWMRIAGHGGIEYTLNRDHPIAKAVSRSINDKDQARIKELFSAIETSIPIDLIYSDYSVDPQKFEKTKSIDEGSLMERLEILWQAVNENGASDENAFRDVVRFLKPFSDYQQIIDKFLQEKKR